MWFADENNNLWNPMSTITNLNDGVGTFLCGNPVHDVFEKALKKSDDTAAGLHVLSHLRRGEQTVGPVFFGPDNHAGRILAFHPGEQVHRGMGYDGRVDPLTCACVLSCFCASCRSATSPARRAAKNFATFWV